MKAPRGAFQKSDGDLPTVYRALIDSPDVAIDALIAGVAVPILRPDDGRLVGSLAQISWRTS